MTPLGSDQRRPYCSTALAWSRCRGSNGACS
jgi:hypothetical protein